MNKNDNKQLSPQRLKEEKKDEDEKLKLIKENEEN